MLVVIPTPALPRSTGCGSIPCHCQLGETSLRVMLRSVQAARGVRVQVALMAPVAAVERTTMP